MRRFTDYVAIVDGLLHAREEMFSYTGDELWVREVPTAPGSWQSPRLPLIVGGQSPTMLRVAAATADVWNTHGPPGASDIQVLQATAEQTHRIDHLAEAAGRNPAAIRRSYTIFGPWDPRGGRHSYEEIFDRFGAVGMTDFVLDWPVRSQLDEFERIAREVLPDRRTRS